MNKRLGMLGVLLAVAGPLAACGGGGGQDAAAGPSGRISFVGAPVGQNLTGNVPLTPVEAVFAPARPGQEVRLERRVGSEGWAPVPRYGRCGRAG